jgi:peptidoglycan/xylan/chitin deacetylase (PgdA/CDA1 family)
MRQAIARPSPWLNSPLVTAPLGWRLRARRLPGVAVLCYHSVLPDHIAGPALAFEGVHVHAAKFSAHMQALARYCHPLSLDQWRAIRRGDAAMPARPVVVTLDDGYRNARTCALPALERAGVPATVFVVTGAIERGELFWYDAMAEAEGEAAVEALKDLPYDEWRARVARHGRAAGGGEMRVPPFTY